MVNCQFVNLFPFAPRQQRHSFTSPEVLPHAVPEYTLYEAALLGGSEVNVTYARYEAIFCSRVPFCRQKKTLPSSKF